MMKYQTDFIYLCNLLKFTMKKIISYLLIFTLVVSCKKEVTSNKEIQQNTDQSSITTLECLKAKVSETLRKGESADGLTVEIPYKGGNGKLYVLQEIQSTGVVGVTAKLNADSLAVGDGKLVFNLFGIPKESGMAKFPIKIGGQTCEFNIDILELGINDVSISYLDCNSINVNQGSAENITQGDIVDFRFSMVYQGGNGKTFIDKSFSSINVLGLTAYLEGSTIANGEGYLNFRVTGTPLNGGKAILPLRFGGRSCNFEVDVKPLEVRPGQPISDKEGNSYKTVYIGKQQWMAENLKTSKYNDGTTIPNITDKTQWASNTTGAWAYYNNDAANNAKYGKLYNWYAVSKTTNGYKNICPTGWHVPTDAEWMVLTDYLGGESIAGGKMKEVGTTNWDSPNTYATNMSLFTGLPGGLRLGSGYYYGIGSVGSWWSSMEYSTGDAWTRGLGSSLWLADRYNSNKTNGFSVRCLRD